jgi:hypothetical protein
MPRRLVTSDLFRNDKLAELDYGGRLFFVGLITNADDDGRLKGALKFLKATIFPYDSITLEQIKKYRQKCHDLGVIYSYSVNGIEVIALTGWLEHQVIRSDRYKESKLPPPDNQRTTTGIQNVNQRTTTGMLNISKDNIIEYKEGETRELKKFPRHFITLRKQVFAGLKEHRGYSSRQPGAEAKAISQMLAEGFHPKQILRAYDLIKKQPFYQDKNLSMMQVRKDIHEVLKGKGVKRDIPSEAELLEDAREAGVNDNLGG